MGIAMDGMKVKGTDVSFPSSVVPDIHNAGKFAVVLDTGTSVLVLPSSLVDSIYSQVPGAVHVNTSLGQWALPCDGAVNVTFSFGYVSEPFYYRSSFIDQCMQRARLSHSSLRSDSDESCPSAIERH